MAAEVNAEITAWANVRLAASRQCVEDIVIGIMEGEVMKTLLERLTGTPSKRIGSLNNLTDNQKVTRVDWFLDTLKSEDLIPSLNTSSLYFARHSVNHVYPVLWHLIRKDVAFLYEIAPVFQSSSSSALKSVLSKPIPFHHGPFELSNTAHEYKPYYTSFNGRNSTYLNSKRAGEGRVRGTEHTLREIINAQLETIPEGRRIEFLDYDDVTDSKVWCCLINSFVPGTFTTEVLLNDRWTIDLVLKVASKMFRVNTKLTSKDLKEGNPIGACAVLAYVFMCGYQLKQATALVKRMEELRSQKDKIHHQLRRIESMDTVVSSTDRKNSSASSSKKDKKNSNIDLQVQLETCDDELKWLMSTYSIDECSKWVELVKEAQTEARGLIMEKMKQRFDILTVPHSRMTINDLCESMVINLGLTNGNGFYGSDVKETLWPTRKLVAYKDATGQFFDDFSGAECPKGSIRGLLGVHLTDNIEIANYDFKDYTLYFESTSRNRVLKKGSKFLYQVFPGTPDQCERLLRKSAKNGNLEMLQKLVSFFKSERGFIENVDECGNTALHLAARNGHLDCTHYLLERGSCINAQNKSGGTPFSVSVEGLHKEISQLLIEWGADIHIRNIQNKTALDNVRNEDLKRFLEGKHKEQRTIVRRIAQHRDTEYLLMVIEKHITGVNPFISLASRCVNGLTLLHCAAQLGSTEAIKLLLSERVGVNVTSSSGAAPLHYSRAPHTVGFLLDNDASVNAVDCNGDTPLHCICMDTDCTEYMEKNIQLMLSFSANLLIENDNRLTPIHCAAANGHIKALELLLSDTRNQLPAASINGERNLIYLSLKYGHLECAEWLFGKGCEIEEDQLVAMCHSLFNDTEEYYKTPLEVFRFLIQKGLKVDTTFSSGKSLLHLSATLIHLPELTDLLIAGGADVNITDKAKMTPLFSACQVDNFYAASTLLKHGADYQCTDAYGQTAFDYIKDHDEWAYSGFFEDTIKTQLKAYSLKHAKLLVKSITDKFKSHKIPL
ncbi:PREDICTED: uncharacterized protein LOC100641129 isoform X2 [Amphimedon queenslandica]|uniref:Uncharacterized protein n=1 Tax=Amphimedon queenslandica TaxID=400682 RepID=A0AAN0J876_AMPQE|nr:PREDICTED: uncharacterized protein LOC100641129 isoform X2 [Amphimedon queenslandica]|eukprot:XP_019852908.1 PREDICTED: uncharacterized protein LOC100641129 isoform X2 [Amphimedon queenslandica]